MNFTASGAYAPSAAAHKYLGLGESARSRLEGLTGHRPVFSWLPSDTKTSWIDSHSTSTLDSPMFTSTTWRTPDPSDPGRRLHLADGIWLDLDARKDRGETLADAVGALRQTAKKLQELGIPLNECYVFASGSKGFHLFLPLELIVPGGIGNADVKTARIFPLVCREFVINELVTDQTDLSLYCSGRGHLLRQANVKRDNGAFKVPVPWDEALQLDPDGYAALCSAPRPWVAVEQPAPAARAMAAWAESVSHCGKVLKRQQPVINRREADRPKILALLRKIDPAALSYTDWLRVGCALKSSWPDDNGLELWVEHSRQDRKRFRPGACEAKWEGLNVGSVGIGTLVMLAKGGAA